MFGLFGQRMSKPSQKSEELIKYAEFKQRLKSEKIKITPEQRKQVFQKNARQGEMTGSKWMEVLRELKQQQKQQEKALSSKKQEKQSREHPSGDFRDSSIGEKKNVMDMDNSDMVIEEEEEEEEQQQQQQQQQREREEEKEQTSSPQPPSVSLSPPPFGGKAPPPESNLSKFQDKLFCGGRNTDYLSNSYDGNSKTINTQKPKTKQKAQRHAKKKTQKEDHRGVASDKAYANYT
ncbi:hypothetical protein RFI_06753, partial [Reticulomyxa filosa]